MSAPARRIPDATGISTSSRKRTGSVVDVLLADAPAGHHQLVSVKLIDPHPRNPKGRDVDVADLVAGITAVGVTNPLIVASGPAYNAGRLDDDPEVHPSHFVIVGGGHRRLAAAVKVGLTVVPCIVRDDLADAKGRRAALFENIHRKQLDPFEEAGAFQELVDRYGVSQRDLAGDVGCNQSHISKRLKLLKLPTTIQEAVRIGRITIADAIEFARIADQPALVDAAWLKVNNWRWSGKQAVDDAIAHRDAELKRAATMEMLTAAGVKIVDRSPAYYLYTKKDPVRLAVTGIKSERHASEPCHAAFIENNGDELLACINPGRHTADGPSKVKLNKQARDQLARHGSGGGKDDAAERRQRAALKKQIPARMEIAARIIRFQHTLDAKSLDEFIRRGYIGTMFDHGPGGADSWKVICAISSGLLDHDTLNYPNAEALHQLSRKLPHQAVLLAMSIAHFDGALRLSWRRWGDNDRYYLHVLESQGYEISDVEHEKLGDKRSSVGMWVPPNSDELKAAAVDDSVVCRVCNNPPGIDDVWVGEDLCSACADAQDSGWLAEQAAKNGTTVQELTAPIDDLYTVAG